MTILPVELQQEIVSYVPLLNRLEYARCNKSLCHELMTRLRIIRIEKETKRFLNSESFRNKILKLIVDPYEQLELIFSSRSDRTVVPEKSILGFNIALKTLSISTEDIPLLLPHITRVRHVKLEWKEGERKVSIPHILDLRKLSLFDYPHSSLASLSDGVQLNQQLDLRSLRYLKLYDCNGISDVSSLGHMYELELISCSSLVDISCLNHNKIIVIDSCPVADYSQSFRFSRDITIIVSTYYHDVNVPSIKGINLDNLEAVQSLTLDYDQKNVTDPLSYTERLPSSLRYLSVKRVKSRVSIPSYNCLKEITFSACQDISLHNLEKIRCVRIKFSDKVTDWSPLQGSSYVEILSCYGFKSGKQFNNVKKLSLITRTLNHMEDLTNITHLKLETPFYGENLRPYIASSARGKKLFLSANNLQEINIDMSFVKPDTPLLDLIMQSPQHKRIIMTNLRSSDRNEFEAFHQLVVEGFSRLYEVQSKPHERKIVLIKKEKSEGRLLFSLILLSLSIIPILASFMIQNFISNDHS